MRLILALLLLTLLASAVFVTFPAIDLAVSTRFFDGTRFPIEANVIIEAIRNLLMAAEDLGFLAILALALRRRPFLHLSARGWLYQTLVFVLGPGVLVNALLKPIWGRPRPFQIQDFGGLAHFTPAWVISPDCCGYRSFVSGEMAGATALAICLALVLRANRANLGAIAYRSAWLLTLAFPLFTFWQRVAAGRHFLSDVVLGFLLVALLAATLRRMVGGLAERQALLTS